MVAREVPRETWMVVAWVSALIEKTGVAFHDGDRVPSVNQLVNDAEGVVAAVARTAVVHFVAVP